MVIDANILKTMVADELAILTDERVVAHIQAFLVEPTVTIRDWDYGQEGERYPCWTVLRHLPSNTAIAYCENGFGPRSPWGLVWLEGDQRLMSIGPDSAWFTTFLQAFFDSQPASELPIWRVFKTDTITGETLPVTNEDGWKVTWEKVAAFRQSDTTNRYTCWTNIAYERE
jgi:hypothetical protein